MITNGLRAAAAAAALIVAAPAPASENGARAFEAVYDLSIGGLRAAEMRLSVRWDGERYQAASVVRSVGLAGRLIDANIEAEASGIVAGVDLAPSRFAAEAELGRKRQSIELSYDAAPTPVLVAEPPLRDRDYNADPSRQGDALDPLSAAVAALAPRPADSACDRVLPVFDGRRRIELRLGPAEVGADGSLHCDGVYRRVDGFKAKDLAKPDVPLSVEWSVAEGVASFRRATVPLTLGSAVATRRD